MGIHSLVFKRSSYAKKMILILFTSLFLPAILEGAPSSNNGKLELTTLYNCRAQGYFVNPDNCKEFFHCTLVNKVLAAKTIYRCPPYWVFDDRAKECRRFEEVRCNVHHQLQAFTYIHLRESELDSFFGNSAIGPR